MTEDASPKPEDRRRRTTRAGRRRARPEPGGVHRDTAPAPEADTLREEDGLYSSDVESDFEDELDEFEALGDLDPDRDDAPTDEHDAAAVRAAPTGPVPLVREPRGDAGRDGPAGRIVFADPSPIDTDPELEAVEAPSFPQMRLGELEREKPVVAQPVLAQPVVVVARATIVGDRVSPKPVGPQGEVSRAQSPIPPPPVRPSGRPAAPPEPSDESGLQLVDVDDAVLDSGRPPPSRSPPPPPPPDTRSRVAQPVSPSAARKPPPPPGPQPRAEERSSKPRKPRQWWERFFSEDYLMTVLPPSAAQIAKQVDFIEASIGVSKGGTILDVGCGLGLHAIELTRRGYLVVALDLSLAMITHASEAAQHQKLRLSFVHADLREMEFDGAFDAAICMGTTFGFFDDEANRDVLVRLYSALRPGGRMLLDVVNRDYVSRFQPNLVWFEGDGCVCMEESDFNHFNARLSVKRTMMREDGHQTNAEYSLRLYSLHELGQLVQQTGFRVLEVSGQEAIRGVFFGGNSPRILMLGERRPSGRPVRGMPPERTSGEMARPTSGMPGERTSSEFAKLGRVDVGERPR